MRGPGEEVETDAAAVEAWAASGAMALTGWPDEPPLGPPAPLVDGVATVDRALQAHARRLRRELRLDALALLAERAAADGLRRAGRTSCGGAARLVRTADGWLAVSLARDEDRDLLPAWLHATPEQLGPDPWDAVARAVGRVPSTELVERGALLGLPVAALPPGPAEGGPPAVRRSAVTGPAAPPPDRLDDLLVVDLSALWAGPLCASLLGLLGATVVKVESTGRPDGARRSPTSPFFALLNAGKRSVALDFGTPAGRDALRDLVAAADVVVEASRPRALLGLGLDARALLSTARPRVWLSITGHGREGANGQRVAFGDDAAVAGGLVAWDHRGEPVFCADAVADPLTGLAAASATLSALAEGGRWLLDASMAGVAAGLAGPTLPAPAGTTAAPPRARRPRGPGPALGADTDAVLSAVRRGRRP